MTELVILVLTLQWFVVYSFLNEYLFEDSMKTNLMLINFETDK